MDFSAVATRFNSAIKEYNDYRKIRYGGEGTQRFYLVKNAGEENEKKYEVDLADFSCSCKDHQWNNIKSPCKHLIITWLYVYGEMNQPETNPG